MMRMNFHEKGYKKPENPIYKSVVPATASEPKAARPQQLSLVLAAPSPGCGSCGGGRIS
jgi:hypothetical protein